MASTRVPAPFPLGVSVVAGGVNVAVYSETAESVLLCVFDERDREKRVLLTKRFGHVFYDFVPGVVAGDLYGLRVAGEWDPGSGLRHNAHKLLLEPHARAVTGTYRWGQALFAHDQHQPDRMDTTDSASAMPRCVVVDESFDWDAGAPDVAPMTRLSDTVIYETHVAGFTRRMAAVPEEIRGTYAGFAHPAAIRYLTDLGVTAVELLPVQQFVQDGHLLEQDLRNYWGYNTVGFFAPHGEYSAAGDSGGQVAEFKSMVKALHAAGLEVILDVVYNHTAEGNHMGPMLSFKGIDNAAYYRLVDAHRASYFDTTGTGNSLNVSHPLALGLIMDSLRYWVTEMHVDGFRFDLATTLTRQGGDASMHSAFLDLIAQDPVLAPVKMIAEPWDTAGYQLGGFPADWSEWNGKFRDDVREFWHGADSVLGTTTQRILGSPDIYEADRRAPLCSVNFITSHDGFTLADLTAYETKHNLANGEGNRDGERDNNSANAGAEGPTTSPEVNQRRARQRRNFLATLLLSAGIPMVLGGDEIGRTQGGNNNAYAQDNSTSWYDWDQADHELLAFTRKLIALRRQNPALRPSWFRQAPNGRSINTVEVRRSDGLAFQAADWHDPRARTLSLVFGFTGFDSFALLLNSAENGVTFTVPTAPYREWELAASSDDGQEVTDPVTTLIVRDGSFTLLRSRFG